MISPYLRIAARFGLPVLLLAGAIVVAACSSSTEPGEPPGDVTIAYAPLVGSAALAPGDTLAFQATVTGADDALVSWTVDGEAAGAGPTYVFRAHDVGAFSLGVEVTRGAERLGGRSWSLTVATDPAELPPVIGGLGVGHGPEPAEVIVSWSRAMPTRWPLVAYEVACSYDGPITPVNWDQALHVATVAWDVATYQHRVTLGEADGMIPGDRAWFSVRVRDSLDQLSGIEEYPWLNLSYAWNLHVRVTDDSGDPMFNAIIRYDGEERVATDPSGRAVLGPLRSIDAVGFETITGEFDVACGPFTVTADTVAATVIRRRVFDHVPCDPDDADFLAFFERVTGTSGVGGSSQVLHRWDHYPVTVWIQPGTSPAQGWDLDALAAASLPMWNDATGLDLLAAAPDSAMADVVVVFEDLPTSYNGETIVTDPPGNIGDVVPEHMKVIVRRTLDTNDGSVEPLPIWVTEVTLHELGHVLGFAGHVCLTSRGNLMDFGGAIGSLDGGAAAAFREDELAVVRTIRHLAQGTDMGTYLAR